MADNHVDLLQESLTFSPSSEIKYTKRIGEPSQSFRNVIIHNAAKRMVLIRVRAINSKRITPSKDYFAVAGISKWIDDLFHKQGVSKIL